MINAEVNTRNLNLLIGDLTRILPADSDTILRDEVRLFQKMVIKLAPPKSLAQGRAAIAGDLLGGRSMSSATGAKKSKGIFLKMATYMPFDERAEGNRVLLWATKKGEAFGVEQKDYSPDASIADMKKFHRSMSSNAGGRIRVSLAGNYWKDAGRWKESRAMVVRANNVNKYVKEVQRRVGRLKASLAYGYKLLGGTVPGWIDKHTKGTDKAIFHIADSKDGLSITVGTRARNARQIIGGVFKSSVRAREQAIAKRMRLILSGYSKDVAQKMRPRRAAKPTPGSTILN